MATTSVGVFRRLPPIKRPTKALGTMTAPAAAPVGVKRPFGTVIG